MNTVLYPEVKYLLEKVGKEVFVSILYPELKRDCSVSIEELSSKYPKFARFTINSQRTRLSKAKKIFELKMLKEAFDIIISSRVSAEIKELALSYYSQL